MKILKWISMIVYAKWKAFRDGVLFTITPQQRYAHGFVLLTSIIICAAVFFGLIPDSTQDKLGYFYRESLLFYFRLFGWVMNVIELSMYVWTMAFPPSYIKTILYPIFWGFIIFSFMFPAILFYGLILSLPQWMLWMHWQKRYKRMIVVVAAIYAGICMIQYHAGYCRWSFMEVQARSAQNIPIQDFYKQCGKPLYWSLTKYEDGSVDWKGLYTNGLSEIRVKLKEDDVALVYGTTGIWWD